MDKNRDNGGGGGGGGGGKMKWPTAALRGSRRGVMYPPAPAPPNGFSLAAALDAAESVTRRVVPARAADLALGACSAAVGSPVQAELV